MNFPRVLQKIRDKFSYIAYSIGQALGIKCVLYENTSRNKVANVVSVCCN
jgi:hypothetical protein